MQPDPLRAPLAAADAVARRLLTHAMDIRFDLEDTREQVEAAELPTRGDLRRLRESIFALQEEVDRLEEALWPFDLDPDYRLEEETDEVLF